MKEEADQAEGREFLRMEVLRRGSAVLVAAVRRERVGVGRGGN